jgi:hypothetical protein
MPLEIRAAIAVAVVLIWIGGCVYAEAWLEKHVKDHNRRMAITPILAVFWWPIALVYCSRIKPLQEVLTELFNELEKVDEKG